MIIEKLSPKDMPMSMFINETKIGKVFVTLPTGKTFSRKGRSRRRLLPILKKEWYKIAKQQNNVPS